MNRLPLNALHETNPGETESEVQHMLFERLKVETQDLHQDVERQLPFFSEHFSLAAYKQVLERYESFYAPIEEKLASLRSKGLAVFDEGRVKHSLLQLDLDRLNAHVNPPPRRCEVIPELETVSQGIGCMYVLEGSTLGGQVILRHLRAKLGITPENGGAFFASYGSELGQRWKEFRAVVGADSRANREADDIVTSARDTFRCFYNWVAR